jgi:hypothetical protein
VGLSGGLGKVHGGFGKEGSRCATACVFHVRVSFLLFFNIKKHQARAGTVSTHFLDLVVTGCSSDDQPLTVPAPPAVWPYRFMISQAPKSALAPERTWRRQAENPGNCTALNIMEGRWFSEVALSSAAWACTTAGRGTSVVPGAAYVLFTFEN